MTTRPDINVILLTGPAGAGKSTAADLINQLDENHWETDSFATPLREMLMSAFGLRRRHFREEKELPLEQLGGRTPRYALQTLGTEWGRELIHPSIWAITAVNWVKSFVNDYDARDFIFDDCRFQNEIDLMREAFNTKVIRIIPSFEGYTPIEASGHASEQQALDWDVTVCNDGDLDKFKEDLKEAIR